RGHGPAGRPAAWDAAAGCAARSPDADGCMIPALLASVAVVGLYLWQDRIVECPDGRRYTSCTAQPYPFHRRWCRWPRWLLIPTSLVCLVALGTLMGTWQRALLLLTLPGAWLVAT